MTYTHLMQCTGILKAPASTLRHISYLISVASALCRLETSKLEQLSDEPAAGSGKTLISVLLIREVLHTHSNEAAGKKVVFLAPTVSLVQQVRLLLHSSLTSIR